MLDFDAQDNVVGLDIDHASGKLDLSKVETIASRLRLSDFTREVLKATPRRGNSKHANGFIEGKRPMGLFSELEGSKKALAGLFGAKGGRIVSSILVLLAIAAFAAPRLKDIGEFLSGMANHVSGRRNDTQPPQAQANLPSPSTASTQQQGGQTGGTINNYGPIFNGPAQVPTQPHAPAPLSNTQTESDGQSAFIKADNVEGLRVEGNVVIGGATILDIKNSKAISVAGNQSLREIPSPEIAEMPDFRGISTSKFKKDVFKFSDEITMFEHRYTNREDALTQQMPPDSTSFERQTEQLLELSRKKEKEFSERYLPRARAIQSEALWRLKRQGRDRIEFSSTDSDPMNDGFLLLQIGKLTGPAPVSDIASYLRFIISKLDDKASSSVTAYPSRR